MTLDMGHLECQEVGVARVDTGFWVVVESQVAVPHWAGGTRLCGWLSYSCKPYWKGNICSRMICHTLIRSGMSH